MGKIELTEELNRIEEIKRRGDNLYEQLSSLNDKYINYISEAYHSLEANGTSNAVLYESCGEIVNHYNSVIENERKRYEKIVENMKTARKETNTAIARLSERESEIREELERIELEEARLRGKDRLPVATLKV